MCWILVFTLLSRSHISNYLTESLKYYVATFWFNFAIIFGQVTSVLLKFLTCRKVGNDWVLWHAGHHKCVGTSFYFSCLMLFIALLIPAVTYLWLFNKSPEKRADPNLSSLTGHYKENCWYFEGIFFIRRFVLASFVAIPFNQTNEKIYSMVVIIIFFQLFVMFTFPFIHELNNYAELIFQSCLIPIAFGFVC